MKTRCLLCASIVMLSASVDVTAQVDDFQPVSEAMLRDPAPGDWLNWRRTDDAWGYSPLDQITSSNVAQLQLAWSWAMDDTGAQEAAPLVHDGVIYLPGPRGVIQALDGATGDLIWEYRPGITPRVDGTSTSDNSGLAAGAFAGVGRGVQKNIAIYGDMIYAATGDASIVAVDARTGSEVWRTAVADPSLGYRYVAGPIVASGKLITGITGCDRYKDDVIALPHRAQVGGSMVGEVHGQKLRDITQRNGIPFLDLLPALRAAYDTHGARLFIPWDGHNSAVANQVIAEQVYDRIADAIAADGSTS